MLKFKTCSFLFKCILITTLLSKKYVYITSFWGLGVYLPSPLHVLHPTPIKKGGYASNDQLHNKELDYCSIPRGASHPPVLVVGGLPAQLVRQYDWSIVRIWGSRHFQYLRRCVCGEGGLPRSIKIEETDSSRIGIQTTTTKIDSTVI